MQRRGDGKTLQNCAKFKRLEFKQDSRIIRHEDNDSTNQAENIGYTHSTLLSARKKKYIDTYNYSITKRVCFEFHVINVC